MTLPGLRTDNLRSQCGDEGNPSGEEGRGFLTVSSDTLRRIASIWELKGKKRISQNALQPLRRRKAMELQALFLLNFGG